MEEKEGKREEDRRLMPPPPLPNKSKGQSSQPSKGRVDSVAPPPATPPEQAELEFIVPFSNTPMLPPRTATFNLLRSDTYIDDDGYADEVTQLECVLKFPNDVRLKLVLRDNFEHVTRLVVLFRIRENPYAPQAQKDIRSIINLLLPLVPTCDFRLEVLFEGKAVAELPYREEQMEDAGGMLWCMFQKAAVKDLDFPGFDGLRLERDDTADWGRGADFYFVTGRQT